jgi:hypothetical protein
VFDGAVIILSLAPMVASTVANGPRSPWDAVSLMIVLRIWRVKRVIDGEWPEKGEAMGAGRRVTHAGRVRLPAWEDQACPDHSTSHSGSTRTPLRCHTQTPELPATHWRSHVHRRAPACCVPACPALTQEFSFWKEHVSWA